MTNDDALHILALDVARRILVSAGESPEHRELAADLLREANRTRVGGDVSGVLSPLSVPTALKAREL